MDDYLKEARLNSKRKYLKETFDYLTDIGKPKKFKSLSNYPPIDKIDFLIEKGQRCFNFKAPSLNLVSNIAQYQNHNYGFAKPFSVRNDEFHWTNPNGVASLTMLMNEDLESDGKTGQIDHPIPVQIDHQFRSKLTTLFQFKLTT